MPITNLKPKDFRYMITAAKNRYKKKKIPEKRVEVTPSYLLEIWNSQKGRCAVCGVELDLKGRSHQHGSANALRATMDRKKPNKGYIVGNIDLLHFCCNSLKGTMTQHHVEAIARGIVSRIEEEFGGESVRFRKQLSYGDDERNHPYPEYKKESDGKMGKMFRGGAEAGQLPNPEDTKQTKC